ncbi:MAG: hypothetical protein JO309_05900 [Pseudonocardiales bacterium]|nr:hypothetical protein [Pseudonocardiales bacterium]MBV9728931.1 hypothetical protein [Pseudonocardiales bacterium]
MHVIVLVVISTALVFDSFGVAVGMVMLFAFGVSALAAPGFLGCALVVSSRRYLIIAR